MRLKWTDAESKYFNKKIPAAERTDDWIVWVILIIVSLSGVVYLIVK